MARVVDDVGLIDGAGRTGLLQRLNTLFVAFTTCHATHRGGSYSAGDSSSYDASDSGSSSGSDSSSSDSGSSDGGGGADY